MTEADIEARSTAIARALADTPGALLPVLHALQAEFGYVPATAIPGVARALNLSRAEVHGVLSFYHLFRREPAGAKTLYVCRAEACQAMGGKALEEHARQRLGVDWHQTTSDGKFNLEPIYCLGNCACSPAIMIDQQLHAKVTPEKFDQLVADA